MSIKYYDKSGATPEEKLLAGVSPVDAILNGTSKNAIQNKAVYNALKDKLEAATTDLINYYQKSDTYNRAEVRALIGAVETLTMEVVSSLPVSDISTTTIYLLKPTGSNVYDEYVYINDAWVKIGTTDMDLSGYMLTADFNVAIADYFTQAEINNLLNSYYTKAEIDADFYDKDAVDDLIDAKQDTLTFDDTPTAGSSNPVTSDGIKDAIDDTATDIYMVMGKNGAKNLLRSNGGELYSGSAHFVTNEDGSITVNGTANAYLPFYMGKSYLPAGTYIVSINEIPVGFGVRNKENSQWLKLVSPSHGYSREMTITSEEEGYHTMVLFLESYASGGTNIIARPMIRLANIPDDTYEPYAKTNRALTVESLTSEANTLTGCKNILLNSATNRSALYGIDWTVYDDGSVMANGTNTGTQSNFEIWSNKPFPVGKYILNGCTGGEMTTYHLYVYNLTTSTVEAISFDGDDYFEVTSPTNRYSVICCVKPNETVNNVMFYPMIRHVGDGDPTFVPYSMTNRELTEYHTTVAKTFTQSSADVATYLRNANTSGYIAFGYSYNRAMITVNAIFTIKASGNALYKSDSTTATSGNENWELIKISNFPYSKAIPDGPLSGLLFLNRTDLKDLYCSKRGNDLIFAISATDYADFVGKGIRLSATIMLK